MTDLSKLLGEIQRPEASHVDMLKRTARGTPQWFLEKDHKTHPIHNRNHLEFFVCGEKGFAEIDKDLRAATSSIDLVLWGFDPGMELVRKTPTTDKRQTGHATWPRGTTYGDLLTLKAREGVEVRLLLWYDSVLINSLSGNVPDIPVAWLPSLVASSSSLVAPTQEWIKTRGSKNERPASRDELQAIRATYCKAWWQAALAGRFPNLEVRMRRADASSIGANIAKYLPDRRALVEEIGLKHVGTHHQKPVLIDYQPAKGKTPNTCGYVMGLNSVTDYWDSEQHLYNDPRRECNWADGAFWSEAWHRKPYRDYAIRVQGEALYDLNENFVQGWDSADGFGLPGMAINGAGLKLGGGLKARRQAIQAKDMPTPAGACHRAQILRTQPEKLDATILKAYTLASSNALNYIYVENQYFQLADWPQLVKTVRGRYCAGLKAAGGKPADIVPLHLFVVIPQPERGAMVPRTYETLGQLGAGQSMSTYHAQVQGVRQGGGTPPPGPRPGASAQELADYDKRVREWQAVRHQGGSVQDSVAAVPAHPQGELEALAIKPLVAMLMTHDAHQEAQGIRVRKRDNEAQEVGAAQEAKTRASGQASDVETTNYSDTNIIPKPYREIYIHSKLMFVDDVYTTLGSANLNARSMVSDSELNICTAEYGFTQDARRRVWGNIAGKDLNGGDGGVKAVAQTYQDWQARMAANKEYRSAGRPPINDSFLHPFEDPRGEPAVRLA